MSSSPRQTSQVAPSDRACLQCQRRKTRCIGGAPGRSCSYCAKSGKACVPPKRTARTPLTRKNLDEAEARCERLEALLQSVSPSAPTGNDAVSHVVGARTDNENPVEDSSLTRRDYGLRNASSRNPTSPGATYAWDESPHHHQVRREPGEEREPDGMASLDEGGERAGYLGDSSGYRMLESMSSLLPHQSNGGLTGSEEQNHAAIDNERGAYGPIVDDWSSRLTSTYIEDQLVTAYFVSYNRPYPILHERTFREQRAARHQVSYHKSWYIIYYMVLAIGEWVGGYSNDKHSIYYDLARSHFNIDILESGNIQNVQAFLIMGNYLQKRDRPNTAFNLIGMAYRMAIGLGLHREPQQSSQIDTFAMHRRRVLFWVLYCFDSGFNITTGRPILMSDSFIDVRIPLNVAEDHYRDMSDTVTEAPYPTTISILIAQARLARIANKIYDRFMSVTPCVDADYQTSVMEQMIKNWRSSLPSYFEAADVPTWFVGPRQVLFWKEANLRIILLIASEKLHNDVHDKLAIGRRYQSIASDTISEICEFCYQYPNLIHPGISWYAVYCILQASLALSLYQVARGGPSNISQPEDEIRLQAYEDIIIKAHQCLRTLARSDKAADRSLRVLSRLHANLKRSAASPEVHSRTRSAIIRTNERDSMAATGASLNQGENNFNSTQQPLTPRPHQLDATLAEASVEAENDINPLFNQWNISADPAFHFFFNNSDSFNEIFQGFSGFPNTAEPDDFDYCSSNMLRM